MQRKFNLENFSYSRSKCEEAVTHCCALEEKMQAAFTCRSCWASYPWDFTALWNLCLWSTKTVLKLMRCTQRPVIFLGESGEGGREEEVVNAAGSIGGNLQMASIGCMRETCGSVGPGLSEVCHSALLLPSSSKLQDSSEVHVCHVRFIRHCHL